MLLDLNTTYRFHAKFGFRFGCQILCGKRIAQKDWDEEIREEEMQRDIGPLVLEISEKKEIGEEIEEKGGIRDWRRRTIIFMWKGIFVFFQNKSKFR